MSELNGHFLVYIGHARTEPEDNKPPSYVGLFNTVAGDSFILTQQQIEALSAECMKKAEAREIADASVVSLYKLFDNFSPELRFLQSRSLRAAGDDLKNQNNMILIADKLDTLFPR